MYSNCKLVTSFKLFVFKCFFCVGVSVMCLKICNWQRCSNMFLFSVLLKMRLDCFYNMVQMIATPRRNMLFFYRTRLSQRSTNQTNNFSTEFSSQMQTSWKIFGIAQNSIFGGTTTHPEVMTRRSLYHFAFMEMMRFLREASLRCHVSS